METFNLRYGHFLSLPYRLSGTDVLALPFQPPFEGAMIVWFFEIPLRCFPSPARHWVFPALLAG